MEIRLATEADFKQVGIVFAEDNHFHAQLVQEIIQATDPIMTHQWYAGVLNDPDKALFVVEIGQDIVGVALIEVRKSIDDPIFRPRRYLYISEIAVAAAYRGQGIGRSLMEWIHQWGRTQDVTEIELNVWERNDQESTHAEGDLETRPHNFSVIWIIRVK